MMKIKRSKQASKKKLVVSGTIIVLLVISSLGIYLYVYKGSLFGWSPLKNEPVSSIDYNPPTAEQIDAGNAIKKHSTTDESKPGINNGDNPTSQQSNNIDITITATNKTASVLQVRALIGIVTNSGTCTLTITKDSSALSRSSDVQALASESTCKGFDIPLAELSPGKWTISIQYKNGSTFGESKKEVTI